MYSLGHLLHTTRLSIYHTHTKHHRRLIWSRDLFHRCEIKTVVKNSCLHSVHFGDDICITKQQKLCDALPINICKKNVTQTINCCTEWRINVTLASIYHYYTFSLYYRPLLLWVNTSFRERSDGRVC